ncbi:hypothetical protein SDC9_130025 [bioreactor metagenome]|uniref:Uncharacterized protein n=1 Tax=bioreactor metagenome TaxID=1076179 RepID=A0A645D1J4_9ZZZZ
MVSETGEIRLNAAKRNFTVCTPRTESVTLESGELAAGTLRVEKADCFQTVAAISLDGKALPQSEKILVLHLTNVVNSGMVFDDNSFRLLRDWGGLPLLLRRGKAVIEMKSTADYRVEALSAVGEILGEVRGERQDGVFRFNADTGAFPGGVMAYQLRRR